MIKFQIKFMIPLKLLTDVVLSRVYKKKLHNFLTGKFNIIVKLIIRINNK